MFIVTNREVDESKADLDAFGEKPNSRGPNELRLAEAHKSGRKWKVSILPDEITPAMAKEVGLVAEMDAATGKPKPIYASRYAARKVLARVNPSLAGIKGGTGRSLVFFVHGFNNDMKAVLDRAAQFEKNYGVEVIAFSWPANGGGVHGVVSYKSDKRDALASTGALDRSISKLYDYLQAIHDEHVSNIEAMANKRYANDAEKWDRFFNQQAQKWCPFSINLVLHSMGNYLFKNMLKSSSYRNDLLVFDNVVLVAADANNADHKTWVDRIQCRNRVIVTINENDGALMASRLKMGEQQRARLGHYPYCLDSERAVYVNFTDARYVGDSHAYFEGGAIRNRKVKQFFNDALNGEAAERSLSFNVADNMYRLE
ncbi:MAG: alpha/beta hydrolase [Candidatus Thiodiazotropha sp.]